MPVPWARVATNDFLRFWVFSLLSSSSMLDRFAAALPTLKETLELNDKAPTTISCRHHRGY
jgi:hypothetical protein